MLIIKNGTDSETVMFKACLEEVPAGFLEFQKVQRAKDNTDKRVTGVKGGNC